MKATKFRIISEKYNYETWKRTRTLALFENIYKVY